MAPVDVAVIGGGIAGVATAAFLADGGLRVTLHEQTAVAAGASGRNSGVVQHPFDPVLAGLYRATLAEYRVLADVSEGAFAIGAEPAGLLLVGHDPSLARSIAGDWAVAWPATRPELLVGSDLRRLEPALAGELAACRLEIGFPVAPASATEAFASLARRRGVEIRTGSARPAIVDGRIRGVVVDGRLEPAGAVVVAGGPWTAQIVEPSGGWRPIERSWGVVANVALADAPHHALEAIDITIEPEVDDDHAPAGSDTGVEFSLVPAAGSSALGSTFLPAEPEPAAWVEALRRVGSRYVPGVATATIVGLRHCARPVSRDGRPLVGRAPWVDGLWIVAGHGPWGISTGPGSARLVADQVLGRSAEIPPALAVGRFGSPTAVPTG